MKTQIVLTGILKDKDLFLIVKRNENDNLYPRAWEFPGGHLEDGETIKECIKMMDFRKLQKDVYQNKVDKGFNTTDVNKEFWLTYAELAEAYDAWLKKKDDVGEELADVVIFTMGLSEILGVDLESEIINKINKNSKRVYKTVDGVLMKVKSE